MPPRCAFTSPRRDGRGKLISERDLYPAEAAVNAKVLHRDTARDLALLQVPRCPPGTSTLRLAADEPDPGERVHLVGCPTGSESLWVYSQGCVRQHLKFIERDEAGLSCRVMQTQLPGSAGESGAPGGQRPGLASRGASRRLPRSATVEPGDRAVGSAGFPGQGTAQTVSRCPRWANPN
jgi:hypothetical protein